jgi:hypothetical protein
MVIPLNHTSQRVHLRLERPLGNARSLVLAFAIGLGANACSSSSNGGAGTSDASLPFTAALPATYVSKVKNLLVGLPPTDDEVTSVAADPTKMKGLVQNWMAMPGYKTKMKRFFELAFQQTQVSAADFTDQTFPRPIGINTTTIPLLVQNAQESFALTMIELLFEGRPLTDATTTNKLMFKTAVKEVF